MLTQTSQGGDHEWAIQRPHPHCRQRRQIRSECDQSHYQQRGRKSYQCCTFILFCEFIDTKHLVSTGTDYFSAGRAHSTALIWSLSVLHISIHSLCVAHRALTGPISPGLSFNYAFNTEEQIGLVQMNAC
jgi:hypothetical protein